jgi:LEA14-like dessication related protein
MAIKWLLLSFSINYLQMKLYKLLLAFALLPLFQGCAKPIAPSFITLERVSIENIGTKESDFSAALKYYNPNNYAIAFKGAEADIFIENQLSGRSRVDSFFTVNAKDTFSIPVKLTIDTKKVLGNALSFLLKQEIEISIKGTAKVGRNGFFMNLPISYIGTQKLKL